MNKTGSRQKMSSSCFTTSTDIYIRNSETVADAFTVKYLRKWVRGGKSGGRGNFVEGKWKGIFLNKTILQIHLPTPLTSPLSPLPHKKGGVCGKGRWCHVLLVCLSVVSQFSGYPTAVYQYETVGVTRSCSVSERGMSVRRSRSRSAYLCVNCSTHYANFTPPPPPPPFSALIWPERSGLAI
jgi:hypothetical protein